MSNTPQRIPLCYPDNFEWDREKGILVKKRKKRGKLVVCEDALEILRSIDGPICPVAVTGPARCGKSYIASQLIKPGPFDCVFQTSNKMQPQTMGIWMGTELSKKKIRKGIEVTVVVMDTEGLGAYDAYSQDDLQLFSLMSLLSSVLVYNSRGSMTAEDIKKLSWIGTLGNVIHVSQDGKTTKSQAKDFIKFFPNFMWLLRDVSMAFSVSRGDEEIEVDVKDFILEEVLKLEEETGDSIDRVKEYNAYRKALLKSFPLFDAVKLSTPAIDADVLANMDKGENRTNLSPDFLTEIDIFLDRLMRLMKPKKAWPYVGNIHGQQFAELLKEYVSEFSSSGGVLNIHSVGSRVVETLLNDVQEKALHRYHSSMDEFSKSVIPCPNHEIIYKHNDCLTKLMKYFSVKSKYITDSSRLNVYRKKLLGKIAVYSKDGHTFVSGHLKALLESNAKESRVYCKRIVDELFENKLKPLINLCQNEDSRRSINVDWEISNIEKEYKERARGPQIWQVYKGELADAIERFYAAVLKSDDDQLDAPVANFHPEVTKADEEETKNREKLEEQISNLKEEEEKTILLTMNDDIAKQRQQLSSDLEENSATILAHVNQLLKTHAALAKELQLINNKIEEENKRMREELMM
ncbi:guanylate-binding protein 2-like [Ptychodera flava]|uniref:guanylate-binding protein 2-like n=1 Tax=Ptychodera flava TaxID=63121 RepID=UPI00396A7513